MNALHFDRRVRWLSFAALLQALVIAGCAEDGLEGFVDIDAGFGDVADAGSDADAAGGDTGDDSFGTRDAGDSEVLDGGDTFEPGSDTSPSDTAADVDATAPLELGVREDCNPLAFTDECLFPHPSDFFTEEDETRETGRRLALHNDVVALPPGAPAIDFTLFNGADGFAPSAPLLVHLGQDIAPEFLFPPDATDRSLADEVAIALYDMGSGERIPIIAEMSQDLRTTRFEGRHPLIIRPLVPLAYGTRHAVILTTALTTTEGAPIARPPGFEAIINGARTDHAALEARRESLLDVVSFAGEQGYAPDDLLVAWDFTTASRSWVVGAMISMREQVYEAFDGGESVPYRVTRVVDAPNDNVLALIEGQFTPPNFLDAANAVVRDTEGDAVRQAEAVEYPFTVIIPAIAAEVESLPVLVFGHGIFGRGRDYLTGRIGRDIIQPLANESGAIVVATDFIGLSGGDYDLIVGELVNDLNRLNVVTDRLQQSLVNNLALIELVRSTLHHDEDTWPADAAAVGDATYYYGVSLGGIQGASLTSLSRDISRSVLAVPGGNWSTMLTRSSVYEPIKVLMDLRYPDPLAQQAFVSLLQARFDGADPVNLGRLYRREPLPDAAEDRRVLVQEAVGDCQVPNLVTRVLARVLDVAQLEPSWESVWGIEPVEAPLVGDALVQLVMPDRLAEYTPPDVDRVPETDNGTHSDAILLPGAIEQVTTFIGTGEITNPCDGPCDPD